MHMIATRGGDANPACFSAVPCQSQAQAACRKCACCNNASPGCSTEFRSDVDNQVAKRLASDCDYSAIYIWLFVKTMISVVQAL